MNKLSLTTLAASLLAAVAIGVPASSHREALAVLNEPCADNTDTYAWVSNGAHDKLYLIITSTRCTSRARATRACGRATATATNSTSASVPA